jgi:hypothetical protein
VTVAALAAWLAAAGFLSLVVAPVAFRTLPRESAGALMSALFPRYYWIGLALGIVALGHLGGRWAFGRPRRGEERVSLALVALMIGLTMSSVLWILPELEQARAALTVAREAGALAPSTAAEAFARLHRLSWVVNAVVMVAGAAALVREVVRSR